MTEATINPAIERIVRPTLGVALVCCVIGMLIGVLGAGFYNMLGADTILGLTFQQIRPLHTGMVVCWIFLAGISCIYYFLIKEYKVQSGAFFRRAKISLFLWVTAGICYVVGILANHFTGREYIPFNPIVSSTIMVGWIILAVNYFKTVKLRTGDTPVYVWMWGVSLCLFTWTFIEAHLYLIPAISNTPIYDLSIQWKSYGSMVGSFNLLVYGSVYFVGEHVFGCKKKARSTLAFSLFFVGILNSFTNYGHHTYHIPQSHFIKWTSFIVSMLEISIFAKVCLDIVCCSKMLQSCGKERITALFFVFGTAWTWLQLFTSIFMSIPNLNGFVHGTHVITSHAMGTMVGIDSMMLWGVAFFLVSSMYPKATKYLNRPAVAKAAIASNVFLFLFWSAMTIKGLAFGWVRYTGEESAFIAQIDLYFPILFLIFGIGLTVTSITMIWPCLRVLTFGENSLERFSETAHKTVHATP
jgi:nitric oxide reductase subunit B